MSLSHLCIEGTKGAGKTTTLDAARSRLSERGWSVHVHALFQRGNDWARTQGFDGGVPMMEHDARANEAMARWLVAAAREERERFMASRAERSLLLSDRGWITLHAYLYEGAWAKDPSALPTIDALWSEALDEAPPTVFIHTRPEVTERRRAGMLDAVSGLQTDARLRSDYTRRMTLARKHADKIVGSWETTDGPFVDLCPAVLAVIEAG